MPYILYILECINGAYYTGITTDLERRYKEHLNGSSKCKYTRAFPPKRVCAYWSFECSRSVIQSLELSIKNLDRTKKTELINNPEQIKVLLRNHS